MIGWEQTFNCGADESVFELVYRTAYWGKTPGQVGSVYFAASGSAGVDHCNSTDFGKPYSDAVSKV